MALQVSTKFKEMLLSTYSFADIFDGGRILIYSGAQPATADHPVTGTLLAEITKNGTEWVLGSSAGGLLFGLSGPYVGRLSGQSWKMRVITTGTAGWFRLVGPDADAGNMSYSHPRVDGTIGTEMTLTSTALTADTLVDVQSFMFTIPPIVGA